MRAALRLGAYQLGFLDVPAHAAANESVELVRTAGLERAVPFTNAVMRRLADGIRGARSRRSAMRRPTEAALKHSYPDWIAETFWREHGPRRGARAHGGAERAAADRRPAVRAARPSSPASQIPSIPGALTVERVPAEWLEQGLVWPQSRGSQLAGLAVGAQPGERILDLCAAPGGKATQLAEVAAEVVAVEIHEGRARELAENAARLGLANVTVVHADALELPPELTGFDRVLVDAPVLGARRARVPARSALARASRCPSSSASCSRSPPSASGPGGTSRTPSARSTGSENEDVVDAAGLPSDDLGAEWPGFRHPRRPEFLLTLPHVHRTSGFFVARMRA